MTRLNAVTRSFFATAVFGCLATVTVVFFPPDAAAQTVGPCTSDPKVCLATQCLAPEGGPESVLACDGQFYSWVKSEQRAVTTAWANFNATSGTVVPWTDPSYCIDQFSTPIPSTKCARTYVSVNANDPCDILLWDAGYEAAKTNCQAQ